MYLNAFRIRIGLIGAGILTTLIYVALGGRFGPGSKGAIQIEYGMYPEEFSGAEVLIDGEVAGTLKPFGSATRTGFEIERGEHAVRIRHPRFPSMERKVQVEAGSGVLLILNITSGMASNGASRPTISFDG
jgi:hypothetical protein